MTNREPTPCPGRTLLQVAHPTGGLAHLQITRYFNRLWSLLTEH